VLKERVSKDGTRKFLFGLEDAETIESVFIPSKNTNTVCVSSQVGCKFACRFCASGRAGFVRNLRPAEMVNQVLEIASSVRGQFSKRELSPNVVFMGMGEPLDNYDNVLKAIRILNAPYGLGIGQRKITISTCGIIPGIKRLMGEDLQIELSVSLHSPDDKTRSAIMAVNKRYPIKALMAALKGYIAKTNRQVTLEYVLIKGMNDSKEAAEALANLIKGGLFKVNLIRFNLVEGMDYDAPDEKAVRSFKKILDENKIVSTIRVSRGQDIEAACGQIRSKRA
jgi:23S rRNA (adenine2503-C2)-methyltransferase